MWVEIVLGTVVGGVLSIIITLYVERLKIPKFDLFIETPPLINLYKEGKPATKAKFLRLKLWNQDKKFPNYWLNKKFIPINTATSVNGCIDFFHFDNLVNVFSDSMRLRWAGSDDPWDVTVDSGKMVFIQNPQKIENSFYRTCFPNRVETIDVAVRFDDDKEAYGWTTDSMSEPDLWRKPKYQLSRGRYFVKVLIKADSAICEKFFLLENSSGIENFKLDYPSASDIRRFKLSHKA